MLVMNLASRFMAHQLRARRRFVVQVYQNGLRLLDGAKMLQELLITNSELENNSSEVANNLVIEAVIADPYMLLKMTDGSLQLVVGGLYIVPLNKISILQGFLLLYHV